MPEIKATPQRVTLFVFAQLIIVSAYVILVLGGGCLVHNSIPSEGISTSYYFVKRLMKGLIPLLFLLAAEALVTSLFLRRNKKTIIRVCVFSIVLGFLLESLIYFLPRGTSPFDYFLPSCLVMFAFFGLFSLIGNFRFRLKGLIADPMFWVGLSLLLFLSFNVSAYENARWGFALFPDSMDFLDYVRAVFIYRTDAYEGMLIGLACAFASSTLWSLGVAGSKEEHVLLPESSRRSKKQFYLMGTISFLGALWAISRLIKTVAVDLSSDLTASTWSGSPFLILVIAFVSCISLIAIGILFFIMPRAKMTEGKQRRVFKRTVLAILIINFGAYLVAFMTQSPIEVVSAGAALMALVVYAFAKKERLVPVVTESEEGLDAE